MKVAIDATSRNVIKYINALQNVDKNAKYVDGAFCGYVLMDINTISDLMSVICWVGHVIVGPVRDMNGIEVMPIEIYDDYREENEKLELY